MRDRNNKTLISRILTDVKTKTTPIPEKAAAAQGQGLEKLSESKVYPIPRSDENPFRGLCDVFFLFANLRFFAVNLSHLISSCSFVFCYLPLLLF
jgi:hypothetical protein